MNPRIQAKLETKKRRESLDLNCYVLKIQSNKLSKTQLDKLHSYFKQAKYLYNDILNSQDVFQYDYKTKEVNVKWFEDKVEHNEKREITLPSQIKQELHNQLKQNISNLSKSKDKGYSVGQLKFKKEYNCIYLIQYNTTYKMKGNKIHIAGIGYMKVNGLDQIKDIKEYGQAKLVKKPSGFYIHITCYKERNESKNISESFPPVGIDFGIKDSITLSNGDKHNFEFDYTNVKKKGKELSKKQKDSKNYYKALNNLKKEYEHLDNKKEDVSNKFVSYLKNTFGTIVIQDENLKGWQSSLFGKQVAHGILGRIKSKLKKLNTTIVIDRFQPTTKICPICLKKNILSLSDRTYKCSCGFEEDRDTKSARTCLLFGLDLLPTEHRNIKPLENPSSDLFEQYKKLFKFIKIDSLKKEALTIS